MRIEELKDLVLGKDRDNSGNILSENVNFKRVGTATQLAAIKDMIKNCTFFDGVYGYLDYVSIELLSKIVFVQLFTDITLNIDENEDAKVLSDYDLLVDLGIMDYLSFRYAREYNEFLYFVKLEKKRVSSQYGTLAAVVNGHLKEISNSIERVMTSFLESMENFEPEKLETAQKLLRQMNDSVNEVRQLKIVK